MASRYSHKKIRSCHQQPLTDWGLPNPLSFDTANVGFSSESSVTGNDFFSVNKANDNDSKLPHLIANNTDSCIGVAPCAELAKGKHPTSHKDSLYWGVFLCKNKNALRKSLKISNHNNCPLHHHFLYWAFDSLYLKRQKAGNALVARLLFYISQLVRTDLPQI